VRAASRIAVSNDLPAAAGRTSPERLVAELWRGTHAADECPTAQRLKDEGLIEKSTDAWGTPFQITCSSDETTVTSFGPDKKPSDDDIVMPRPDGSP
jgi:hypothetical protein